MLVETTAIESTPVELQLDTVQLTLLRALGRELAANSVWWGRQQVTNDKSVVEVRLLGDDKYSVKFRDVVGVVRLGGLQVRVKPKIPELHFSYIIRRSEVAPRTASADSSVGAAAEYFRLLALWCVKESEALLRRGLRVDYAEYSDELEEVRGRIDVIPTAMLNYLGQPLAFCQFEELGEDTPLNRVIRAACQSIAAHPRFDVDIQRRANRVVSRMESVGRLKAADRYVRLSRLTLSYHRVLPLAKLILQGSGVSARVGDYTGTAFLLRTPELIESGLRNIISGGLHEIGVRKQRLLLGDTGMSINPDLVFGDIIAVGDVKYRYLGPDWDRTSLYQAVAFASAFRTQRCAIFGFTSGVGGKTLKPVPIGDVLARSFAWDASQDMLPNESEKMLLTEIRDWIYPQRPNAT